MRSSGTPFMKFGLVSRGAMAEQYIVVLGIAQEEFEKFVWERIGVADADAVERVGGGGGCCPLNSVDSARKFRLMMGFHLSAKRELGERFGGGMP